MCSSTKPTRAPTISLNGGKMVEVKAKIKELTSDKGEFRKPEQLELVIIPKKKLMEWFQQLKSESDGNGHGMLECPHCRSRMEEFSPKNRPWDLWHHCPHCNLTFSDRQYKYFHTMIMRLIKGDFTVKEE